jgi:hypothetical protein
MTPMPPWKYRRILIYFTCILACGMIVFAASTYRSDTQVATQLIVGGVALLSITLTAYTGFATYEDTKLWKQTQQLQETIYPESETDEQ